MSRKLKLRDKFIPVNKPKIFGTEKKLINECLKSGWISSEGPFVEKFEHNLSKKIFFKFQQKKIWYICF